MNLHTAKLHSSRAWGKYKRLFNNPNSTPQEIHKAWAEYQEWRDIRARLVRAIINAMNNARLTEEAEWDDEVPDFIPEEDVGFYSVHPAGRMVRPAIHDEGEW